MERIVFPNRISKSGKEIDAYLRNQIEATNQEIHRLFSFNRREEAALIVSKLMSGTTIICDRYAYSGVVYSAAKDNSCVNDWKADDCGLPAADVVVYLSGDPNELSKRGEYGSERYEKIEFQEKIKSKYESLKDNTWITFDAMQDKDVLAEQVHNLIRSKLTTDDAIEYLW